MRVHVGYPPFISCQSLTDKMIGDALAFLLEGEIKNGHISQNRLVITTDIGWANSRNSHHSEVITKTPDILATLLHHNEL